MQTVHELLSRAEEFQVLAKAASNPLAKAQWSIMAHDYRERARKLESFHTHEYLSKPPREDTAAQVVRPPG